MIWFRFCIHWKKIEKYRPREKEKEKEREREKESEKERFFFKKKLLKKRKMHCLK